MKRAIKWMGVALGLMALPGAALAQEERRGVRLPATERGMERDVSVLGQAGVLTYTGEAARLTTPGAAYGVAVSTDVVPWVDAELGYQGAVYMTEENISLAGNQFRILENGGQALAKVGPDGLMLEPYVLTGLTVTRQSVIGTPGPEVPVTDGNRFKLPVGAGVDWEIPTRGAGDLRLGARATYNFGLNGAGYTTLSASSTNQFLGTVQVGGSW